MQDIEKVNSGMLFPNEDKKSDKAPDISGQVNIEGQQYRIAGWLNEGKNGDYWGLQFTALDEEQEERPARKSGGYSNGGKRAQYTKPSRR